MRGMQCPKQLWLDTNKPELKIIPEQTQRRLDRGNEFGDKAMAMFGPFVEVTEYIRTQNIWTSAKWSRTPRTQCAAARIISARRPLTITAFSAPWTFSTASMAMCGSCTR